MADQTQRLEIATVRAEVGSNILYRFANDAANADKIPTQSGDIQNLKQVLLEIQQDAAEKISISTTIYPTVAAGLAATADQGIFLVQSNDADEIYTVWQNQGGTAVNTGKTALSATAIQTALDASNQAAQAAEQAADNATERTAGFLAPAALAPATRDNGLPLQEGDRYFNTAEQAEYIYTSGGWEANDSQQAIADLKNQTDPDKGAAEIGLDGSTVAEVLNASRIFSDYSALRIYEGSAVRAFIASGAQAGWFMRVGSAQDDNGVFLKDGLQRTWYRAFVGPVRAEWYGAVPFTSGQGVDSQEAFAAAYGHCFSNNRALAAHGKFRLASQLDLRQVRLEMGGVDFIIDAALTVPGVLLGGAANQAGNPDQTLGKILRSDNSLTYPACRIIGAKNQRIRIDKVNHVQLWASTSPPTRSRTYSIAYSTFDINYFDFLSLDTDPANDNGPPNSDDGGAVQWINENTFNLKRGFRVRVSGSYDHNHNIFNCGTLEGAAVIEFIRGKDNVMNDLRLEEGPTVVKFGPTTSNNIVWKSWTSGQADLPFGLTSGTIEDEGVGNFVLSTFVQKHTPYCAAQASISDPVVNNRTDVYLSRQPHLQRVGGTAGNSPMCRSDMLPAYKNLFLQFVYDGENTGDVVRYRPFVEFYDKNLLPIPASPGFLSSNGITSASGNTLSTGTGGATSWGAVTGSAISSGVAYVRAGIRVSGSQTANALARRLRVFASYPKDSGSDPAFFRPSEQIITVSAIPTAGYAPVGFRVFKTDFSQEYICTASGETAHSIALVGGEDAVELASVSGIAVNDLIGINLANRDTHWSRVSSISGSTVTIAAPIPSPTPAGDRVVFSRWIAK